MRNEPCRYLQALDYSAMESTSPVESDCFRAQKACYLARQGNFSEAESIISMLRDRYSRSPNASISGWLNLAEGLCVYFSSIGSSSKDKIMRAHALSMAADVKSLKAVSAAWLSQINFTMLDVESMARNATLALGLSEEDDYSARSRVGLVLAQALHVAGRFDLALPWYRLAHRFATLQGDDATVSALIHNMACMRLDNLRQFKLSGAGDEADIRRAMIDAASTDNFDTLIGATSFKSLKPLLHARALSLQGCPAEALSSYEKHISLNGVGDFARMTSDVLSDVAWCRLQLGMKDAALEAASAAEEGLVPATQVDDRAATHTRLHWLYANIGKADLALDHKEKADKAWEMFVEMQQRIIKLLAPMAMS